MASSSCRAAGWSSALSPGSDATGVSPRTSRTLPKPWAPSLPSPQSSLPSGGLPGRRSPTHQTAGLRRTMVKVCKSDCEGTIAGTRGNGEVAPIAVIGLLFGESSKSTHLRPSEPPLVASVSGTSAAAAPLVLRRCTKPGIRRVACAGRIAAMLGHTGVRPRPSRRTVRAM
jgi:hypothetical protein